MAQAHEIPGKQYTYYAAEDLHTKLFYPVKSDGSTDLGIVACNALGEDGIGVLQNDPTADTGNAATVMVDGVTKAIAGAAIPFGAEVVVGSDGRFLAANAGNVKTQVLTRSTTGITGTITLSADGETTATIPATDSGFTPTAVQNALRALSNIGSECSASGSAGGPITVTGEIPTLTVANGGASGGTISVAPGVTDTVPDAGSRLWGKARTHAAAAGELFALDLYHSKPKK